MNEHRGFVLVLDPQDNDSGVLTGWIRSDIREVQIQGHQNSVLRSAGVGDFFVIRPREVFVSNRVRIKTGALQYLGRFGWEILVNLEFHAVSSAGSSMEPSRTNSAA